MKNASRKREDIIKKVSKKVLCFKNFKLSFVPRFRLLHGVYGLLCYYAKKWAVGDQLLEVYIHMEHQKKLSGSLFVYVFPIVVPLIDLLSECRHRTITPSSVSITIIPSFNITPKIVISLLTVQIGRVIFPSVNFFYHHLSVSLLFNATQRNFSAHYPLDVTEV